MGDAARLFIDGPAGKLEAALRTAPAARGVVVLAHPHPLYGGTMGNPVIFHADRELNRSGLTTLRFNFRGVGASDGFHDDGRGEIGDVAAASAYASGLLPGGPLILVGYSFGSRCVIAHAIADPAALGVVAIGLPVRLWAFEDLPSLRKPLAVVPGTNDEYGSIEEVEAVIARAEPPGRLYGVPGATHLFPGRAAEAAERVVAAVSEMLQTGKPAS